MFIRTAVALVAMTMVGSAGAPLAAPAAATMPAAAAAATTPASPAAAISPASPAAAVQAVPIGVGAATTGGAGGRTVTVSSASAFLAAVQSTERLVVAVNATISLSGMNRVASNKTITGVGTSGRLVGGGLNLRQVTNVIVQNLFISGSGDDNINVEESTNIWIDHNDLSGASDGSLDIKRASDLVTVSWNRFHDQDKNGLIGHSDDNGAQDRGRLRVTYHHNWFEGTNQRNPRVRFGNPVHVLNNYYSDIGSYGVASTMEAGVLVEGNYFENVDDPYHRGEGSSPAGTLVARNNHFVSSGAGDAGGSVNPIPYSYSANTASAVKSIVQAGAGPGRDGGGGGDTSPPSTPGTPSASNVTSSAASLSWAASSDNVGVTGYEVYREQGTNDPLLGSTPASSITLTGLSASTQYQVYVRARDAAGNVSPASPNGSFTTLPGGGGGPCRVNYLASNWSGTNGFTAGVTIANTGSAVIDGWTLRFSFTAGQRLTDGWSATWAQPAGSAAVSATNLDWNRVINPGGSVGIGFNGTFSSSNPPPNAFTVNGTACSIG